METVDLLPLFSNDFAKLGCESLEGLSNMSLRPPSIDYLNFNDGGDGELKVDMETDMEKRIIRVLQVNEKTPVFGIDTSNIILGNTEKGLLSAVRGSVVWRENGSYQYVRHGPFIFHITERNRHTLYNSLRQIYLDVDDRVGTPILEKTVDRIRSILERWIQKHLCEVTHNSLILWDGSLTTRTVKRPISILGEILHTARNNCNQILAFSKKTTLTMMGQRLGDLIDGKFAPCLLDIDKAIRLQYGSHLHFFGKIFAVKLSPTSFTFRLDIDRRASENENINAIGKLLGNEILADGYPETLRMAHILSRFSASEILAMQRYVAVNYGLRISPTSDVRQVLFGPYGGQNNLWSKSYDASL
ncbi:MAG: DNA double-strand break repair nuclease NurA [Candidatus Bathyarchaeota archaeon]